MSHKKLPPLTPAQRAEARRILDREARRKLAKRLAARQERERPAWR